MSKREDYSGILNKSRLEFRDNAELEKYYEDKYQSGGYEGGGCVRFGINVSQIYHEARHASAFAFVDPQPGDVVLDAGCGTGSLAARIAPHCHAVHAIDIAGNALAPAYQGIPNLKFEKMNLEQLTFQTGMFDKIVCVEALEHAIDPDRAMAELFRALKRGGHLVVTYPTINRTAMQRLNRMIRLGRPLAISEHLNEWSFDEVVQHLEAAGFALKKAEGLVFDFGLLGILKQVSRFFAQTLTRLSLNIRSFPRNSSFVSVQLTKP